MDNENNESNIGNWKSSDDRPIEEVFGISKNEKTLEDKYDSLMNNIYGIYDYIKNIRYELDEKDMFGGNIRLMDIYVTEQWAKEAKAIIDSTEKFYTKEEVEIEKRKAWTAALQWDFDNECNYYTTFEDYIEEGNKKQ